MRGTGKTSRSINFFVEQLLNYRQCIIYDEPDATRESIQDMYKKIQERLIREHGFDTEKESIIYEYVNNIPNFKHAAVLTVIINKTNENNRK